MPAGFRIHYGIVSDDARREDNGKLILIGLYGANINVPTFPVMLVLALTFSFSCDQPLKEPMVLRASLNDERIMEAKTVFESSKIENGMTIMPGLPIRIQKEGILIFQIRFESESEWITAAEIPVTSQPTSSEQPSSQFQPGVSRSS